MNIRLLIDKNSLFGEVSIGKLALVSRKKGSQHMPVLSFAVAPGFVRNAGAGEDVVCKILWSIPQFKIKHTWPSSTLGNRMILS
jgi:hypothetical protein